MMASWCIRPQEGQVEQSQSLTEKASSASSSGSAKRAKNCGRSVLALVAKASTVRVQASDCRSGPLVGAQVWAAGWGDVLHRCVPGQRVDALINEVLSGGMQMKGVAANRPLQATGTHGALLQKGGREAAFSESSSVVLKDNERAHDDLLVPIGPPADEGAPANRGGVPGDNFNVHFPSLAREER
jgi:hypothetical protein